MQCLGSLWTSSAPLPPPPPAVGAVGSYQVGAAPMDGDLLWIDPQKVGQGGRWG